MQKASSYNKEAERVVAASSTIRISRSSLTDKGDYNISCYIFIKGITINFINIKKSQLFIDFVYKSYYKEAVLEAEKKLFKRIIFDIKILKI